jgi:hypothetical protein
VFTVTVKFGHLSKMPVCKHGRIEGYCECWRNPNQIPLNKPGATTMPTETKPETIYECDHDNDDEFSEEGPFTGTIDELDEIDDIHERVAPGEFMAAGCCPVCGNMLGVDDADVPDYTIRNAIEIARARGLLPPVTQEG